MEAFASEEELLNAFVDIIRALDPDVLIGYDVQKVTLRWPANNPAALSVYTPVIFDANCC